jgi:hypothetical protein
MKGSQAGLSGGVAVSGSIAVGTSVGNINESLFVEALPPNTVILYGATR